MIIRSTEELLKSYQAGVNLGGWISQYPPGSGREHFDSFIDKKDIERIASWGVDHVRLPFDYPVLEACEGLEYIESCISWCKDNKLNLVLDMHKAPGYSFNTLEANSLFDDGAAQGRFLDIWRMLAERLKGEGDNVVFELLNEVVEPDSKRWNSLAKRAVEAIRGIDKSRKIIVGSNNYSSIFTLRDLDIIDDAYIIYTFHFYEPHLFTHQKAHWNRPFAEYNQELSYPGEFTELDRFLSRFEEYRDSFGKYLDLKLDKKQMHEDIIPVIEFMKDTGKPVYCGEYGVIENTPLQSRINWHRDFTDAMKALGIGRAVWTYKCMNFGLVDRDGKITSEELVRIISDR